MRTVKAQKTAYTTQQKEKTLSDIRNSTFILTASTALAIVIAALTSDKYAAFGLLFYILNFIAWVSLLIRLSKPFKSFQ